MAHEWHPSTTIATLAIDTACTLGEGLLWDVRGQRWCWTDIEEACAYTWVGGAARPQRHALPQRLGCFAIATSGRWLLGLAKGLAWGHWDGVDLRVTALCPVEAEQPGTRINDGRTDRHGRFVFGTLHEAAQRQAIGHFYQFSLRHGLRRLALPPVRIANSICFSPDGGTMYFTDTPSGVIQQCSYDSDSAEVGEPRPFARVAVPGFPDGSVVDADGCLWNAQWGGARVQRFSPGGALLAEVQASAPQVTCPAFGGPDLGTLMFTSARESMGPEALARAPTSGSLFSSRATGCRGLAEALFEDPEDDGHKDMA
jgi:L-arabinonolactonase